VSPRAGIVVTGTEVLSGIISDANGPWISERLRELGVDVHSITIVGDRRDDLERTLRFLAGEGVDLVVTSGGLGPTADDLTGEVVAETQGHALVLDAALERRITEIVRPMLARWPGLDTDAVVAANRKQALVPRAATVLDPVGTAPGLVVPPSEPDGPTVVVLPGPPHELHAMWPAAVSSRAFRAAVGESVEFRSGIMRLFGIPESEIAATLRAVEEEGGLSLSALEITTCLRRGEIEIATRFEPGADADYAALERAVAERHADTLFSLDGTTIDDQVAALLLGPPRRTVATAESCTGGLLAARLTERAGSSAYALGGIVAYANEAKAGLAGVDPELIVRHGAVSREVADALADGARDRFGADVGAGVTGVAGPGGGTDDKPVGTVWVAVAGPDGARLTRGLRLPGGRVDVRDRSTTVAFHLLRRLLRGERDA
jgi:nicotinamide-nucleotide amidase